MRREIRHGHKWMDLPKNEKQGSRAKGQQAKHREKVGEERMKIGTVVEVHGSTSLTLNHAGPQQDRVGRIRRRGCLSLCLCTL